MAQSVIVKKEEKVSAVVASLPTGFSEGEFIDTFIEMYPKGMGASPESLQRS